MLDRPLEVVDLPLEQKYLVGIVKVLGLVVGVEVRVPGVVPLGLGRGIRNLGSKACIGLGGIGVLHRKRRHVDAIFVVVVTNSIVSLVANVAAESAEFRLCALYGCVVDPNVVLDVPEKGSVV